MQRLSGLDASFLYLETSTSHMHVASTVVYDPSSLQGDWDAERVKEEIDRRLHLVPPFRRRLKEIPFQLHHPLWIEDPDFDLDYHVRQVAAPGRGGRDDLAALAGDIISRPMDRSRPLWDMTFVEGLEDGSMAVVTRTHHAAIDGASGMDITVNLLDLTPEPAEIAPPEQEWKPDRIPTDIELVGYAAQSLARQPVSAFKAVRRTATAALTLRQRNRQPDVTPPPAPFSAPHTPFNGAITARRSFGMADIALDDVKAIRTKMGGTVNDIVLAICAGALRSYLDEKGALPEEALVAMCPISVRTEDQKNTMGNQVSSMLVSLATTLDDPTERVRVIQESTRRAKEQAEVIGADTLMNWTEFAAPAVANMAMRLYSRMKVADRHRPLYNTVISNVPGPQFPLYMAGAKMLAMYPMGPLNDGSGLNMTLISYMGQIHFGLVACPDMLPDVDHLADLIPEALQELKKAAGV
ncbi:MAG TPA: wax ester/triacylglycerol synthase family O-acyltransferase [Acidimicrobiales bacterium]|nr:wax ester/triacylglycerol synthase family O-acyltransferase [Acidimicrobiales bacterium]